jgi:hypothetical protein
MSERVHQADSELPFPVLEERSLPYIPRKFLRGARRDLNDLPQVRPGTVLVFHYGSRYVAFGENKHLTGAEEPVVDATAVCLVDTRTRHFTAQLQAPSANPADDFTIRVVFAARVTIPERAAEEGPIKLANYLKAYLERDSKLSRLGNGFHIESIARVRDLVVSRIEAYCEYNPINLPGLAIDLASAAVLPSHELRLHERAKRDEIRRQEVEDIRIAAEERDFDRLKARVNGGPADLAAIGLVRNEISVSDLIQNAREDERSKLEQLAEALRILQKNGGLDYIDIDPTDMARVYFEKLTGQPIMHSDNALRSAGNDRRDAIGSGSDDEDDEAPDEAGLDE